MISPQQIQERRRDELLRRQLGPQLLAAIADPAITDIIVNEDGRVWFEAHGKGLYAAGFVLPESHRESVIGTVAAALGTTADNDHPIVEGELPIERIRFVSSGTEATLSAVRLARGYTGRDKIVKFAGCYHGHADAFLIAAGSGALTGGVPDSPGVTPATAGDTIVLPFNDEAAVEAAFQRDGERIAALVVEPYPGNMGLILPRSGYLAKLRELCTRFGAVLIFDEVMTGFRVARGGVQEHEGVYPDLTTLGKVIGGGMPVGAFGGKREIMEQLAPDGPVYQAGTLSGNPVAMAAGIATMNLIAQDPQIYERFDEASRSLADGLTGLLRDRGVPSYATAAGAMFCLFFTEGPVENLDDVRRVDRELFGEFYRSVLECGVYFAPSPFESNFLCAAHTLADLNRTLAYCAAALDEVLENRLPARAGKP